MSLSKPNDVEVAAGSHHVEMYVPWVAPVKMGPAEIDISLEDGDVVELVYKPPWIRTKPGTLKVSS